MYTENSRICVFGIKIGLMDDMKEGGFVLGYKERTCSIYLEMFQISLGSPSAGLLGE